MNLLKTIGIVLVVALSFASFTGGIGASTYGGVYTTHQKIDRVADEASGGVFALREGGGEQPVASWNATYCGRFGILDSIKCVVTARVEGDCGNYDSDDFRIVSNKVGLRRLNWLKRGVALNIGLP